MAERRLHGLQRVLGVNARSSTAYGNLGSSIYYALGPAALAALSFVVVSVLDLQVGAAGVAWMAAGMGGYVLYRRRQGLDLVSTHEIAVPQPVTLIEAEYEQEAREMRGRAIVIPLPPRVIIESDGANA